MCRYMCKVFGKLLLILENQLMHSKTHKWVSLSICGWIFISNWSTITIFSWIQYQILSPWNSFRFLICLHLLPVIAHGSVQLKKFQSSESDTFSWIPFIITTFFTKNKMRHVYFKFQSTTLQIFAYEFFIVL